MAVTAPSFTPQGNPAGKGFLIDMDNNNLTQAQRALDRTLRLLPERLRALFETVCYEAALQKLREAQAPSPEWITVQLRALRIKARTIQTSVSEMAEQLSACLRNYTEAGGTDVLRIAHAREKLLFLAQTRDDYAAQAVRLTQLRQSAELLRTQEELLDALSVEQLRRRLAKAPPEQGEAREEHPT